MVIATAAGSQASAAAPSTIWKAGRQLCIRQKDICTRHFAVQVCHFATDTGDRPCHPCDLLCDQTKYGTRASSVPWNGGSIDQPSAER